MPGRNVHSVAYGKVNMNESGTHIRVVKRLGGREGTGHLAGEIGGFHMPGS